MASMPVTMPLQGGAQAAVARTVATLMAELGLKTGLPVSAQVIGPLPDGTTQVQILDRMLKLPLPQGLPAGTTVSLQLRPGPEGQQLAVTLPPTPTQSRAALAQPASPSPLPAVAGNAAPVAAQPEIPLAARPPSAPLPQPPLTPANSAAVAPPGSPAPSGAPTPASAPLPQPPTNATPAPVAGRSLANAPLPPPPQTLARASVPPVLRAMLAPPAQTAQASQPIVATVPGPLPQPGAAAPTGGTPPPPTPQAAPVLTGTVTGRTPEGLTQISVGNQTLSLPLKVAPPLGSQVTISAAPTNPGRPSTAGAVVVQPVIAAAVSTAAPPPAPTRAALPPGVVAAPPVGTPSTSVMTSPNTPPPLAPITQAAPPPVRAPSDAVDVALRDAGRLAAGRQTSLAPLLTTLAQLQGRLSQLPAPVAQAAMQLLGSRINAERPISGAALQQAAQKSGIFLEAEMGTPNPAQAARGDVKANLLRLQGGLATLFGAGQAPVEATRKAPPPLRGLPPRAQAPDAPPPLPESREAMGKQLLGQAEGALHRLRLSQMASLPDAGPAGAQRADGPAEWNLEVPMMLGRELTMLALQINRDGRKKQSRAGRGWQMKFSLNFSELGEVGASVTLREDLTSIALWAEDAETAEGLNALLPELADGLAARGVHVGSLVCRVGAPRDGQVATGRLVDARK